jgi:hypothetical protein
MRANIQSEAAKTTIREALPAVSAHVWKHHPQRCREWPHGGGKGNQ